MNHVHVTPSEHAQHLMDHPDDWIVPDLHNVTMPVTLVPDAGLGTNVLVRDDLWFLTTGHRGRRHWVEASYIAHSDCNHQSCVDVHIARLADANAVDFDPEAMMFAVTAVAGTPGDVLIHAADFEEIFDTNQEEQS